MTAWMLVLAAFFLLAFGVLLLGACLFAAAEVVLADNDEAVLDYGDDPPIYHNNDHEDDGA